MNHIKHIHYCGDLYKTHSISASENQTCCWKTFRNG